MVLKVKMKIDTTNSSDPRIKYTYEIIMIQIVTQFHLSFLQSKGHHFNHIKNGLEWTNSIVIPVEERKRCVQQKFD